MRRVRNGLVVAGRILAVVVLVGLAVYLTSVGLDRADKIASCIGVFVAFVALVGPYLVPNRGRGSAVTGSDRVEDSGDASATRGGEANTGIEGPGAAGPTREVKNSGNATADGPGATANTGIRRRP